jgi:eukaryotic-like serine/threonine-protein kinase
MSSSTQLPPINIVQNIRQNVGKAVGAIINLPDPDAERLREARSILIARVRSHWIEVEGAARHRQAALQAIETDHNALTHGAGLLQLPKRFTPDAVDFSSQAADAVAHLNRSNTDDADAIPPERPISEIFNEAEQALLVLGAPGAGKTVTLLQLARDALHEAEANAEKPVPVIFDLAAWANEQLPIVDWIARELNTIQYGIPQEITRIWLRNNDLLLLLDGLNELAAPQRRRCVERLNEFARDRSASGLIVCCRSEEYRSLPVRLTLRDAITLEPLDDRQLAAYFEASGDELAGLYTSLQQDQGLHELAATPLMLHIMSSAYADVASAEISIGQQTSPATWLRHIFEIYVNRMFRYGGEVDKPYPDSQTTEWLSWLARQMEAHNRPVFLIEYMQPSWLPSPSWQWIYMLASRASIGLIAGLVGGVVIGMALAPSDGIASALQRGMAEGLLGGLLAGLGVGCIDMVWIRQFGQDERLRAIPQIWQSVAKIALTTLTVGAVVALLFGLIFGAVRFMGVGYWGWLGEGMLVGMLAGLSASLLFAFGPQAVRYSLEQDIQTVERVSWSRVQAWRGGVLTTGVGLIAGAISGIIAQGTPLVRPLVDRGMSTLSIIMIMTLIGGMVFALIGVIFGGFAGTFRKVEKVTPNEGMRLSLINAGWVALVVGAVFAPVTALIGFIIGGGVGSIISYLFYGLFIGVLASMWYGGLFVLQHAVLRLLLWWTGYTPPLGQYARLLDYAAQRIFLYKVGGGYKFINLYVQEHFAAMTDQAPLQPADQKVQEK